MRLLTFLAVGLLVATSSPSKGAFSGLALIPTTDTVGANQYSIEFQTDGSCSDPNLDTRFFNTEFGIGGRFESGVDLDISEYEDGRVIFNAKYVFLVDQKRQLYVAAGYGQVESRNSETPYIVATKVLKCCRVHCGSLRLDSESRWFVGADKALNHKWTVMVDYTNGSENYSSAAVNYQLTNDFGILAGLEFPNDHNAETLYTLQFSLRGAILSR